MRCSSAGFFEVRIEAGLAALHPVLGRAIAGDRDDAQALQRRLGAQQPRELVAVDVRQADVEERHIGLEGERERYRLPRVGRALRGVAERLQQRHERRGGVGVVFHDQDPARGMRGRNHAAWYGGKEWESNPPETSDASLRI